MRRAISNPATNHTIWTALGYGLACLCLAALSLAIWREYSRSPVPVIPATESDGRWPGTDKTAESPSEPSPGTIVGMQPFRQTASIRIRSAEGKSGRETLINLNPSINAWYLLTIAWDGAQERTYHLENPAPLSQTLTLSEQNPHGIVIREGTDRHVCTLLGDSSPGALEQAASSQKIYAPLCEGRLYLRNPAKGRRTTLESATDFLRNKVWGGEKVIDVFHHLLKDTHRKTGTIESIGTPTNASGGNASSLPLPALIDPQYAALAIKNGGLGIPVEHPEDGGLRPGAWYPAADNSGIYVSLLQPGFISPSILQSYKSTVGSLDRTESSSLCYLVAFDLDQLDLAYALGTAHPGVGWSPRVTPQMRDPDLPGPDGIGSISPLVSTGLVGPEDAPSTVAAFTGGFKREHGAFRYGDLAQRNHGSHYGVMQDGVVFSKLQPGLATILVLKDGRVELKTWEETDNQLLPQIRYARQNGVPLVEFDKASQSTVPGALVNRWGPGNWSGSEDMKLRTIRAGIALQQNGGKRFLLYAVFSDATPSAMARVFQVYQCQYALLTDMNALEHTYLAVYRRSGSQLTIDHLIRGMDQVDMSASGQVVPRFLGYPDNRDFFYLTRRGP